MGNSAFRQEGNTFGQVRKEEVLGEGPGDAIIFAVRTSTSGHRLNGDRRYDRRLFQALEAAQCGVHSAALVD